MEPTPQPSLTEAASAWLVALDAGTADQSKFEAWRSADPRHAVAFAEVAARWRTLDRLRPLRNQSYSSTPDLSRRQWLQAAGFAGVAVVGGVVGWPFMTTAQAETTVGERRRIRLPDGTMAELNTRSQLRWSRFDTQQRLWLDQGEIALDIPKDAQPVALASTVPILLFPGRYNVRSEEGQLSILTLEGVAQIDRTRVPALSKVVVRPKSNIVAPAETAAIERARSWRNGEIVFEGETLDFAVREYNRYLSRPIAIIDPSLRNIRLGGRFSSADPAPFLSALQHGFALRVEDDGRGLVRITRG